MKKVLIGLFALASVSAFANEGINVYGRIGLDVHSKFNTIKEEGYKDTPKKGKTGVNFALEVTKDITPNLELGAGLAYTVRKDSKMNGTYVEKGIKRFDYKMDIPRYESFPLYLTAKYNFDINSAVKPYVKADLGYSFNKNIKAKGEEIDLHTKKVDPWSNTIKVKNGLYTAIAIGAEYNNFITDLAYVHTNAKLKYDDGDTDKYNNGAVRLSVGYKFNF